MAATRVHELTMNFKLSHLNKLKLCYIMRRNLLNEQKNLFCKFLRFNDLWLIISRTTIIIIWLVDGWNLLAVRTKTVPTKTVKVVTDEPTLKIDESYQRILGNCMWPIWKMTSTVTFRLKPWWIEFLVMRPPIGWNEFPTIFWSDLDISWC